MKIGIFCDVSNLYYCLGRKYKNPKLNFTEYRKFCELGEIVCCYAYGIRTPTSNNFEYYLQSNGFTTSMKSPTKYKTTSGHEFFKADCDVAITVEVLRRIDEVDVVILGSADSDYVELVKECQRRGKKVVVIASGITKGLLACADKCIEIPKSMTLGETVDERSFLQRVCLSPGDGCTSTESL